MHDADWCSTLSLSPNRSSGGCSGRRAGRCRSARSICGWAAPTATCGVLRTGKRWGRAAERLVTTERFDEAWYPGEAVGTVVLVEQGGKTTLTQTILYESREARDAVLKTGMERRVAASYDRLAELLPSLGA